MAIFITGGAGFIGSHLCERLLKEGKEVIAVDDFNDFYDPEKKKKNIEDCAKNKKFKIYKADIRDKEEIKKIFEKNKINVIVHLAARAGVRPSMENPLLYIDVNVNGTLAMLELAKKFNIKKFIFASSSSVYGSNDKIPFSEDDPINNPLSPYAITKIAGEQLCRIYSKLHSINMVCLRFFTVYGPRGRPDMAPYKFTNLIMQGKEIEVYGNGSSKRDYTFVSDIIDGIATAVEKELKFEVINLGDSNPVELKYLISLIEKNTGKKAKIKFMPEQKGDVPITYADVSKAKRLLGYKPKVKIEEGVKRLVEWYKNG
ncbi:MAG: SDR family NAD(P)-dependent oxidoreductase [Candidatus Woesearchaeota archaeon]|nr:SDR family NAD(P)-dependent oxidoreductase [Candidatus Woesearchaeota archaeon]